MRPSPPPLFGYIDLRVIEFRFLTFLYEIPVIISDFQQKIRVFSHGSHSLSTLKFIFKTSVDHFT